MMCNIKSDKEQLGVEQILVPNSINNSCDGGEIIQNNKIGLIQDTTFCNFSSQQKNAKFDGTRCVTCSKNINFLVEFLLVGCWIG